MKVRLNKAHYPVSGLGPGRRIGLWFQGCSIRCEGCVSLDTWGERPNTAIEVDEVVDWCMGHLMRGANGVTVSGGEPFDQASELRYILEGLRTVSQKNGLDFDVLCYTGFTHSIVEEDFFEVLSLLDAIVTEPFEVGSPTNKYLCGSENQVLRLLTETGRARYQELKNSSQTEKHMDVSVSNESMFLSGIPRGRDLEKLRSALKSRGVSLGKVSWLE